jgi:capsular polysaccharide biosynthesis protein
MLSQFKESFKSALLKVLKKIKVYHKYSLVPSGEIDFHSIQNDGELIFSHEIKEEKNILPITLDAKVHPKFDFSETPYTNFLLKAKNWKVWGNQGAVITSNNYLFRDVSREYDDIEHSVFKQFKLKPSIFYNEIIAVLAASGAEVYYHWMIDILPRINLLKKTNQLNEIDKFIINYKKLDFQSETLARAGIDNKKILSSTNHWDFHISAKTLLIPSLPSPINRPSLESALYLRSLFSKEIENDAQEKRIYVQRAKGRTIINEEQLLSFLLPLGFEVVKLEDFSVAEQASLFSKAEIIIGPHGSGFTNIVFCKPNTVIIDLFSPNWVNPCFWILSNHLGLKYAYLIGTNSSIKQGEINKGADMHIKLEEFEAIIKKAWQN